MKASEPESSYEVVLKRISEHQKEKAGVLLRQAGAHEEKIEFVSSTAGCFIRLKVCVLCSAVH